MNEIAYELDLVVLVADTNMKFAVDGLLSRPQALSIRPVSKEFIIHPEHDPGCLLRPNTLLNLFVKRSTHAIVMFDRSGCGQDNKSRDELERQVETALAKSGWEDREAVIVIDPELENWVFSDSPEVDAAVGWEGRTPRLRAWLEERNFLDAGEIKPAHPKEAMEAALKHVRMPRSSSIYRNLAQQVSFKRCEDGAFEKLKNKLREWFPVSE